MDQLNEVKVEVLSVKSEVRCSKSEMSPIKRTVERLESRQPALEHEIGIRRRL